ncbi:phage tail assembly protein [Helicobacter cappadocius]|uniref:Phage tail assembly protein n=1 Tax=Helicobacter cappadocius TaxID=3063998 RepID=A0AA90PXA7_9HELI|nr:MULTISPECIES: phage tail assembly protein [unclassified Helicobacter]MDO7253894.1 hypothetical protein [Helicobacter sp. faydin-H75]MDP2539755.1 hypothetical protein [Helicobacter sp. faydin-H76]
MSIKIEREIKTFSFKDGQEIVIKEPTLLQISSAQSKSKDELEVIKTLLIDITDGELDRDSINALPFSEFVRLSECVKEFVGINEKD